MSPVKRLLIDVSGVDFSRQPSGIPRVVLSYLSEGIRWGRHNGVDVIPVLPSRRSGCPALLEAPLPPSLATASTAAAAGTSSLQTRIRRKVFAWGQAARAGLRGLFERVASRRKGSRIASLALDMDDRVSHLAGVLVSAFSRMPTGGRDVGVEAGDLLFCPAYWHDVDPAFYRWVASQGCEVVILVHDILPISMPEFYRSPWRDDFRRNLIAMFDIAAAFLCVSDATRREVAAFAASCNKSPYLATARNGFQPITGSAPSALAHFRMAPLLMVGSVEPKKGHLEVIEQLEAMWNGSYLRPLLIVGRSAWMSSDIVRRIRTSQYFGTLLFWSTDFSDADLAQAYASCHALVFASVGEGFGLPLIEASMYRKPSVVRRIAVSEEVLGEFAIFYDGDRSLSTCLAGLEEPEAYLAMCEKLTAFSWPGWEDQATRVYKRLQISSGGRWNSMPSTIC